MSSPPSSVTTNEDADQILRHFIKVYEEHPNLWDPTEPNYLNKVERNVALDKLAIVYAGLKPGATRLDVRKKINTLRCNYRKDMRRIVASMEAGKNYQPTSWVFYQLRFLRKLQSENLDIHEFDPSSDFFAENDIVEEPKPSTTPSTSASPTPPFVLTPIVPPKPKIKKVRTSETILPKLEVQQATTQDFPTIAKVWGEKLVMLDSQQRAFAEKAINDILFEASQGTLDRYSVKINENREMSPMYETKPSIRPFMISQVSSVLPDDDFSRRTNHYASSDEDIP